MFRLAFFAVHETRGGPRRIDVSNHPQSPPCRVLAVDDNHDAVDTLQPLLEAFGHDVRIAYDGPTAIEIARTFRPDVVLLDLALPKMNGYEVAAQLFDVLGFDNVKIVAMTGYGREEDRQRTRTARFSDHLVKPVEAAELAQVLAARCPTPPDSKI